MDNSPPTTHRITEFFNWHKEKRLVLATPYQRKPVWGISSKSYLINTILNRLPIPEIFIQVKTDSNGVSKYEVVDGQQRINAIIEFIEGKFQLSEEETPNLRGKGFSDLADGYKENFWDYNMVVRELRTNKDSDVRQIFKRLNKNVYRLTPQELRHAAFSGHFIKSIQELADEEFWFVNKIVTPQQIRRMKDAEFISELLIGMMKGPQNGTKELDKYYELYENNFKDKEKWKKLFTKTQQYIKTIFHDLRGTNFNGKADFYALFIAIADLLQNHLFLMDEKDRIKKTLTDFRRKVTVDSIGSRNSMINEYSESIYYGTSNQKDKRIKRIHIIKSLLLPFVAPKDSKRHFTGMQRQYIWDMHSDKHCAICNQIVEFVDFEADHKISHTKGGKTIISNAQITHKKCNISKNSRRK